MILGHKVIYGGGIVSPSVEAGAAVTENSIVALSADGYWDMIATGGATGGALALNAATAEGDDLAILRLVPGVWLKISLVSQTGVDIATKATRVALIGDFYGVKVTSGVVELDLTDTTNKMFRLEELVQDPSLDNDWVAWVSCPATISTGVIEV